MIPRSAQHPYVLVAVALATLLSPPAAGAARDPIVCTPNGDYVQPPVAPAPVELDTGLDMNVWEGATPDPLDDALPTLVLVHGLHGSAEGWFGETMYAGINDFYDHAYDHGYKVFMVDLWDARDIPNPAEDGIDNGKLLKQQIDWIIDYWGVPDVNVIAHSKGGVDSNIAALMGAPIDTLVTLSGAHRGSPLADLAQSDLWPDWLIELIGYNDEGTKFMQTGCMDLVRDLADARPENEDLHIYTSGGTDWGPDFSALAFAGLYLGSAVGGACPSQGFLSVRDNDGVVCVAHARHPWGRNAAGVVDGLHRIVWDDQTGHETWELDHDNLRTGAPQPEDDGSCHVEVFEWAETYAGEFHVAAPLVGGPVDRGPGQLVATLGHLFRGGRLVDGRGEAAFPVEDGVARLDVGLLSTSPDLAVELVSPAGDAVRLPVPVPGAGPFGRAFVTVRVVRGPQPGVWRLRLAGDGPAAWGLAAGLRSPTAVRLGGSPVGADGGVELELAAPGDGVRAEVSVRRTSIERPNEELFTRPLAVGGERFELPGSGVYNLRVTVRGRTAAGWPFERSGVVSVGVPGYGEALPDACR